MARTEMLYALLKKLDEQHGQKNLTDLTGQV
jgi:hypothetical protein